jgi:hypothetical protein
MNFELLLSTLTNPTLLFFILGIVATAIKSDLEIPAPSAKFISLYLLFSIGFKGGQELVHGELTPEIYISLFYGLLIAATIPLYSFFLLKKKLGVVNAGAIAATYGSVSAVTFVAAAGFLEAQGVTFGGHMVAVMALMEVPAIVVGVLLIKLFQKRPQRQESMGSIIKHAFTNGSVVMILGSLVIGILSDSKQAEGIKPFTTDIFKGFLAIFLLEMGMLTAKRIRGAFHYGSVPFLFGILGPLVNGCAVAFLSKLVTADPGNRFMFAVLAASASYIAVPASLKLAVPDADPGLYVPLALGITFPFNITIGMPLYMHLITQF